MQIKAQLMDERDVERTLQRLTHEILEKNCGTDNMVIIGIRNRGDHLARRIVGMIDRLDEGRVDLGLLDITLYRDDFSQMTESPVVQGSEIDFDLEKKKVVLVDDVLYTGRTIRAALDAIMDLGRPAMIQLAVLIDRGHRELPIKADYVGKNVPTAAGEEVQVMLKEIDGEDKVVMLEKKKNKS